MAGDASGVLPGLEHRVLVAAAHGLRVSGVQHAKAKPQCHGREQVGILTIVVIPVRLHQSDLLQQQTQVLHPDLPVPIKYPGAPLHEHFRGHQRCRHLLREIDAKDLAIPVI